MQTTRGSPASAASMMASAAKGGGTKITEAFAPGRLHGFFDSVEDRPVQMCLAAFTGRNAAHHVRTVSDSLLRVEGAFAPSKALKQNLCILIYEDAHLCQP